MPLTQIQKDIIYEVVANFLNNWAPTPRKKLINQFEDPDALDQLVMWNLFRQVDNLSFLPNALSFHYCGRHEAESLAKQSIQIVARVLKKLRPEDKPDLSQESLEKEVESIYDGTDASMILRLGLYLAPDFNLLTSWSGGSPGQPYIVPMAISERVVKLKNIEGLWDDFVSSHNPWPVQDSAGGIINPRGVPFSMDYDANAFDPILAQQPDTNASSRSIFLVHGHDEAAKQTVARFLEKLDLKVVILHEKPSKGRTVIEKFEQNSDVRFAVVLLTPDDVGATARGRRALRKRARQNVILELGYFIGKLGRSQVCALHTGGVELPSDINGVIYVPYDSAGGWKTEMAKEIKAAGIDVDMNLAV